MFRTAALSVAVAVGLLLSPSAGPASATGSPADGGTRAGLGVGPWSGIARQMSEAEYHLTWRERTPFSPGTGAWEAPNRGQALRVFLNEGGLRILPPADRGETWTAGLFASAYGTPRAMRPLPAGELRVEGRRGEFRRGDVVEWYVNGVQGVEQGFTLERPPVAEDLAELNVAVAVTGDLRARADDSGVALVDAAGSPVLRVGHLTVLDASGARLPARLRVESDHALTIVVDARTARFPIVIDPLVSRPTVRLTAFDGAASDQFGEAMAVDGDLLAVASRWDDGFTGSVYLFRRNEGGSGTWGFVAKITASDGDTNDGFGEAVDLDGDRMIVGAFYDETAGNGAGSAYVFERNAGGVDQWGEVKKLLPTGPAEGRFGGSVAIEEDRIAIGAWQESVSLFDRRGAVYVFERNQGGVDNWGLVAKQVGPTTDLFLGFCVGLSGDVLVAGATGDDDTSSNSGAVFVYGRNQGGVDQWGLVHKVKADDADAGDDLGRKCALDGETLLASARNDDEHGDGAGAAYVFRRNAGGTDQWGQVRKLAPVDIRPDDGFGAAVDLLGDTAVVSSYSDLGAAYVFARNRGGADGWGQVGRLAAPDTAEPVGFGRGLAIDEGTLVVGGPNDDTVANDAGVAFVFERAGSVWTEIAGPVVSSDPEAADELGRSIAVDGDTLVVGAPDKGSGAGAVYVFARDQGGGGSWGQVRKLTASDEESGDAFGIAVDVDGDRIVVGAHRWDGTESAEGAAYVFERNTAPAPRSGRAADEWGEVARLASSDPTSSGNFGTAVAIDGDRIAVGALREDGSVGAAYVFERNEGGEDSWGEVRRVSSPDGLITDEFGTSVALDANLLAVGASHNDQDCGSNTCNQGAVYVFERNLGGADTWGLSKKLVAADADQDFQLGLAVRIEGDIVLAGAPGGDPVALRGGGATTGTAYVYERNHDPADPGSPAADEWGERAKIVPSPRLAGFGSSLGLSGGLAVIGGDLEGSADGSAFVFGRHEGGPDTWGQRVELVGSDSVAGDEFGEAVDASGNLVVAGAPLHVDSVASGVAYVFELGAPEADLGITKENGVSSLVAGTMTTYELRIDNAGASDVVGARVHDSLPAAEAFDVGGASWVCAPDVGAGPGTDCPATGSGEELTGGVLVDIEAGEAVLFSVTVATLPDAGGPVVNSAYAEPEDVVEADPADNFARDEDDLVQVADLRVSKTDGETVVPPGTQLAYSIVVVNDGPSADDGVQLTDVIPAELTCTWTCAVAGGGSRGGGGCPEGPQAGNVDVAAYLDLGAQIEIDATCDVDPGFRGSLSNTAQAASIAGATDPDPSDDSATDVTVFGYDFGDAPDPSYPTLEASDGARHVVVAGFHLGAGVDGEGDATPSAAADGDDLAADDEDGVVFVGVAVPGESASVVLIASGAGLVDAWIDFDGDGDWGDAGEQVLVAVPVAAGTNPLEVAVPEGAALGRTFARFRFGSEGGLAPTGLAADGEVEDHTVEIAHPIFFDGFESGDTTAWSSASGAPVSR